MLVVNDAVGNNCVGYFLLLKLFFHFLLLQVSLIVKHEKFMPLSSPGGDGRNDIALLYIRTRGGKGISFDKYVSPACLPIPNLKIKR